MTELIPGKRYRVTVEGVVNDRGSLVDSSRTLIFTHSDFRDLPLTVELLPDPLPTTPGSVVRVEGMTYLRQQDGDWGSESGAAVNDAYLSYWPEFTVLFDAGAQR